VPNYDLGTAHGKIVVDYKDTGTGKATADLTSLRARAKEFSAQFSEAAKKYSQDARNMANQSQTLFGRLSSGVKNFSTNANQAVDDVTRFAKVFGVLAGAIAFTLPLISKTGDAALGLKGGLHILTSMRLALGAVPKGAEGFPTLVKKIIQVSAAVSLFHASTSLIAKATSNFRLLSTVGKLVGNFGNFVHDLAGPLRIISSVAGAAATALLSFRIVKQLIKPVLAFTGALAAVGAAIPIITGVVNSVRDLSGLIGLLPATIGVAALALGTLIVGFSGFGKALKAIGKGDAKAFNEAIKDLAPNAQGAARAIRDIYEKGFKPLRLDVQQRLFAGVGDIIQRLGALYMPLLQRSMGNVADSFNRAFKDVAAFFDKFEGSSEVANDLGEGLDFTAQIVDNLTKTLGPLTQAFYMIWRVGVEALAGVTSGAGAAAQRFADFIKQARESGKLRQWIDNGITALKDLYVIISNIFRIAGGMWKALSGGDESQSFLYTLNQLTTQFNDFVHSVEGQKVLGDLGDMFRHAWENAQKLGDAFMTYVLPALEEFMPVMQELSGGVIDGIILGMKILSPIFIELGKAMQILAPFLRPIITGLVALGVVAIGLGVAFSILGKAFTILRLGFLAIKGAFKVASFGARLLTGNLNPLERKMLSLARAIVGKAIPALRKFAATSNLLKTGAIIAGLAAITVAADNLLPEADQSKLKNSPLASISDYTNHAREDLSGFADFVRGIMTDPTAEIKKQWDDLSGEFSGLGGDLANSPLRHFIDSIGPAISGLAGKIGGWLSGVGTSFKTALIDPIVSAGQTIGTFFSTTIPGFFAGLPAKITGVVSGIGAVVSGLGDQFVGWLSGVGDSFKASLVDPLIRAGESVKTFFTVTLPGYFDEFGAFLSGLGPRIGGYLSGLGGTLATAASNAWESFKQATIGKFDEIAGTTGTLPYRIGFFVGALVGMAATWATDTWNSFLTATKAKFLEIVTEVSTWPARIAATLVGLATTLYTSAQNTFNSWNTAAEAKFNEFITWLSGIPARVIAALSTLGAQIGASASGAWSSFKLAAVTKFNEVIAEISTWPGRVGASLAGLAIALYTSAQNAFNAWNNAAKARFNEFIAWASGVPARVVGALSSLGGQLSASASAHWGAFKAAAQAKINEVVADARAFPARVGAAISSLAGQLSAKASAAWASVRSAFNSGIASAVALAASLPGRVASVLSGMAGALFAAGRNLIQGFVNGIRSMVGAAAQAAAGVVAGVRAYFPFSPAKKGPFSGHGYTSYSGEKLIADFAAGMLSNTNMIANAAAAATNAARLSGSFNLAGTNRGLVTAGGALPAWTPPSAAASGAVQTTNTFHVTIPAKDIAEMKNVADFFSTVTQRARAGKATR
jgi:hypothetical protein